MKASNDFGKKAARDEVVLLQTCLPDYRLPLLERLQRMDEGLVLVCGKEWFDLGLKLCVDQSVRRHFVKNRFFCGRQFLWQVGAFKKTILAGILIAEFNPRIVSTWVIVFLRCLIRRPTIFWGHVSGQFGLVLISRLSRKLLISLSNGLICYSIQQQHKAHELFGKTKTWAAANSCVSTSECKFIESSAERKYIVFVGRLIKGKKPEILLKAFAKASQAFDEGVKLFFAGDGPERLSLMRLVVELRMEGKVEIIGHVGERSHLTDLYKQAFVAVSPGYVGLSAIQCMAAGVPMLVSANEFHSPEIEACVQGKTCELFKTDDVDDLAANLIEIYTDRNRWRIKGPEISGFIASNYTLEAMVDVFRDALLCFRPYETGDGRRRLALVWAQYGPYHLARLNALAELYGREFVVGVEFSSETSIYKWQRKLDVGVRLITLDNTQVAEKVPVLLIFAKARKIFRRESCGVVFVPSYWPLSSLAVYIAARSVGARVVVMGDSHEQTAKAVGLFALAKKYIVRSYDAALLAGTPQKEYFVKLGFDERKIVTGYDAIDNSFFIVNSENARINALAVRNRYALPKRFFLNIGRMVEKKNLRILIDAYAITLARVGRDCPALVLVGDGDQRTTLLEHCVALGLSIIEVENSEKIEKDRIVDVYFYKFMQIEDLPAFYGLCTAFVLPSREDEWGLVVNEAMASGAAVIVSNRAGCAQDLVEHERNGYRFDSRSPAELARYLERLAGDVRLASEMGRASRQRIRKWGCERFATGAIEAVELA